MPFLVSGLKGSQAGLRSNLPFLKGRGSEVLGQELSWVDEGAREAKITNLY